MYYPKSQITPNLYTIGNELFLDGESYTGYYFKTSDGKFYSGKTPNDSFVVQLYPNTQNFWEATAETEPFGKAFSKIADNWDGFTFERQYQNPQGNYIYSSLKPKQQVTLIPFYNPILPTQQDYQVGEFRRYFCKKANELIYIEIDFETFGLLKNKAAEIDWALYIPFNIPWQLTGDKQKVYDVNRNITLLAMRKNSLPKFDQYLKEDYTKYYQ